MSEPFLAEIMIFAGNFAPRGWALCNGQLQSIAQNTALFSLLGTTYGGDGVTTFGLPDLRGRIPVHEGTGPGLSPIDLGESYGSQSQTILVSNLPGHNHSIAGAAVTGTVTGTIGVFGTAGGARGPNGNLLAGDSSGALMYQSGSTPDAALQADTFTGTFSNGQIAVNAVSGMTGGSQPISVQPPSLGLNFCIALEGIFPARN